MDLFETARKHALRNALLHGSASAGAVMGKVVAEAPDAKKDMKVLGEQVAKAIAEVNALSSEQIAREAAAYPEEEKPAEGPHKLRLQNAVEGKVVTRFLPEPNGFLHIGHAKAAWLSRQAADDWNGRCLLRFDDTNPEKEEQEYVDAIASDAEWLGLEFDAKPTFTSDLMPQLYKYAEKLVSEGNAYLCTCIVETVRANRESQKECACRGKDASANLDAWQKMKTGGFDEGQAILRLKGDMKSLNSVMRDPTLFRIIGAKHYLQGDKYHAWPTYDFEVSISDSLNGVTHALRSKEYELRDELYYRIIELAGLAKPFVYDFARLNIKGTVLSKRFLKPLIDEGKVMGWDDPRLPTIRGLRRRGILPAAIKKFALSQGLGKVESEPTWETLLVDNRRMLDAVAERYFFVSSPVEVIVEGVPANYTRVVELPKHPKEEKGKRNIRAGTVFFISGADAKEMEAGTVFRLKELYNVKVKQRSGEKIVAEFAGVELLPNTRKLQWVPGEKNEHLACKLLVPGDLLKEDGSFNEDSLKTISGYCEKDCGRLKEGSVVQLERTGFARLDDEKTMTFVLGC
jgi:glutamyl-tRNA synthetase